MNSSNIYITGFSGTGKTTVSGLVAERMGWTFVDIDDEIVRATGKSIEEVFRSEGELRFREMESKAISRVADGEHQVISTGGGIVVSEHNRRLLESSGIVVCLEARSETIHRRLSKESDESAASVVRPILIADDMLTRISLLKAERQSQYAQAHWVVDTDYLTPDEVADEVIIGWRILDRYFRSDAGSSSESDDLAAVVSASTGEYPIWVGWGNLDKVGDRAKRAVEPTVAYVITDEGARGHGRKAQVALEAAGVPCHLFVMPSGEQNKNLEMATQIYTWLVSLKAERGHMIVAVGGGVVGDLAGFVAATFLRGMRLCHVPTSLLAMMDAAIGGKTAVDMPEGKNLVGAIYQPQFVLEDAQVLESLPQREYVAGMAEAIKHGLILDEELLRIFEDKKDLILSHDRHAVTEVIRRSVRVKAVVVSGDENESMGRRILLNYGHTIGHAIEVAGGYDLYRHGEAVSIGMMGAAMLSNELGLLSVEEVDRQRDVLVEYGLPVQYEGLDVEDIHTAMTVDKKTLGGDIQWVLLERIGCAVTRRDVSESVVRQVVTRLRG